MIRKLLIGRYYSSRGGESIKYLVIHDTGNFNKGANAYNHHRYFSSDGRKSSCHYLVDNDQIIQLIEDYHSSWHCGDGKGRFGIRNSNSIGIELCVNEDGDWKKTKENGIRLIQYLLEKHNLKKESVIRHFDASLKLCPRKMVEMGWREWTDFYDNI